MSLVEGFSRDSIGRNVKTEERSGKPEKQAVAIALNTAQKAAEESGEPSKAPAYEGGFDLAKIIKDHDMPSRMMKALGMGDHVSMPEKMILTVDKFSKGQPFAKLEKGSDRLTYKGRERMKKSEFAIPSEKDKENPAGHGAYPINDIEHARNALARVAQHGTPEEQAEVRRKVHAKYPSIDEE